MRILWSSEFVAEARSLLHLVDRKIKVAARVARLGLARNIGTRPIKAHARKDGGRGGLVENC
eukprot:6480844-Karenia_brevis.AAC.1